MAEELDEFGIPIKRKQADNGTQVDEFGIPVKKKVQSVPSQSGVATRGTTSVNPLLSASQPTNFNFAQSVNPQLQDTVRQQENSRSQRLSQLNQVYNANQGDNASQVIQEADFTSRLGNATKAGLAGVGRMVASVGAGTIDSYSSMNPTNQGLLGGLSVLTDWIKDIKVNNDDNVATQYFKKVFGSPIETLREQKKGENDIDAEKFGQITEKYTGLPEEYNPLSPNNAVAMYFKGVQQSNHDKAYKGYSGGIVGAIKDGKWSEAGKLAALGSAESLPIMLAMVGARVGGASGNQTLAGLSTGITETEYQDLKEQNPDLDKNVLLLNARLTGLGEAGSELVGTNLLYDQAKKLFVNGAKEEAEKIIKNGAKAYLNNMFKKSFVGAATLSDASGEMANQIWKNATDKWTGVDPERDYTDGVLDAGIISLATTGTVACVTKGVSKIYTPKTRATVEENVNNIQAISSELDNPNITPEARVVLQQQVESLTEQTNNEIEAEAKKVDKLPEAVKAQAEELTGQLEQLQAVIADRSVSPEVKATIELQIKPLEDQIDRILSVNESIPVKKGTDVAIDDTIELVNGKTGRVTGVEGDQITMKMADGATFMATPNMVEMNVVKPKEATQSTKTPDATVTSQEVIETPVAPVNESQTITNEVAPSEVITEEVVTEDLPQKRTQEILTKAEDDLKTLKQVNNKTAKYTASVKRLNEAFRAGEITEQEFNDTKLRFDDVMADSVPNMPKADRLTIEETTILDNELKNENLTTNDFIEYERSRAIPSIEVDAEVVQQPADDTGASTTETPRGETTQKQEILQRRQSIKDRISQKLKEQRGNLSSGFDPSLLKDFVELGATYIEEGVVSAKDFIKRFREDYRELGFDDNEITDEEIESQIMNPTTKKATALKNKDIAEKRAELGLEEREAVPVLRNTELVKEAEGMIKEGYDVQQLIDDILDGKKEATAQEVIILKNYQLAKENELVEIGDKIVEATEQGKGTPLTRLIEDRDMIIQDISRAYDAGERTGTVSARALQARKVALMNDFSLANMLIQKREANGGVKLTSEQIDQTTEEYNRIKKLNDKFQRKIDELTKENEDLKAGRAMKSLKNLVEYEKRQFGRVEQRQAIDKDINDAWASLSKKVKAKSGTLSMNAIPVELIPDLAKIAKLYAKKGINTIEGIVDAMYTNLKGDIEGLTKEDLKEVLVNYDYEGAQKEEARLKAFKKRTEAKTNELRDRVGRRDFARREFKPIELDAEALDLQKELRKARYEWEYALELDALARRTKLEKARDITTEILNTPRALMASVDYSAPLRQGLVLGVGNPVEAGQAFVEMFRQSWSQDRFDKWLADLKETPMYAVMKESGLYIADPDKPNLAAKEEQFMSNLAEKIPFLGRAIKIPFTDKKIGGLIKGSERAYVSYLNKLRADVFTKTATVFENEGKTIESDKKLYEALATYINAATGRGDLGKLENSAQILNSAFFSPRLIASRVRLLTNWANPVWYANTPKAVRIMYMKDMLAFVGVATTILGLAALAGADVEKDPRSSDFAKIRVGDKRWDILGGFQQFIRFFTQMATGQRKSTTDKAIREINGEGYKGETRADLAINMIRSKLAPVPAMTWNLASGRTLIGEEYTLKDVPKSFVPLFAADLYSAVDKEGVPALLTTGIGAFGISVQDYSKADKTETMSEKEMREEIKKQLQKLKTKE